jgi:hypothetical protein
MVKVLHTIVWAFFAACIVAIPVVAAARHFQSAFALIGVVALEVLVLLANGMRCPLTGIAARYTAERTDNFDIFLPRWLAASNKLIFGSLYAAGVAFTLALWTGWLRW